MACRGVILFTGVGKSGFIAQKISQTLVSTGTKAMFLNPTDALHGDIGIVGPADLLVALSKSGTSEELLKLMPYARVRRCSYPPTRSLHGTSCPNPYARSLSAHPHTRRLSVRVVCIRTCRTA
jgi:arabinose-5-phosphate isomerase